MKKKIFGAAVLIVGTGAALAAAAIPAASVTASPEPVPGIIRQAEAYASADPIAEKGMQEVVRLCMAKAGFDYTPPSSQMTMDLNGAIGFKRLTVDAAKSSGYASTGPQGHREPAPESADGTLFANPAFTKALTGPAETAPMTTVGGMGTSSGGCRGEAMTQIYGSAENYMLATGIAYNSVLPASLSASGDPGITKAVTDWAACMKDTPYASFANPQQASDAGQAAGGQEEFKIAVTDAVCRDKTGFHAALDKVLDKYLTTRMQELAPQISKVKEIRRTADANAATLNVVASK
ncbi:MULTISPECIES: hypothetical protein [unclassified Arthrobacter]|uniref:hypothetical protein n=1 Tax=unclassified Arthrobacter TaxID=235627 RepID=UPI002E0673F0|nr:MULTISPECIES: hypothetical protein [unclassified Arthrobacter]MEC5193450.1 hypothetical protein [Arthrobacter sp. MP_M4]MEC5204926.1 hypothetical protein [Arthrobacter sp. MP_M7]